MRTRTWIAATAAGALALTPATALAQDPGMDLTANIPSYLELILGQPDTGFGKFASAKTYSTSFAVKATSTLPGSYLAVEDGDATGKKVGRLASGSKVLSLPLEARVGKATFASLDAPVWTPLTKWSAPHSNSSAKVDLRQTVEAKTSGSYRKLLLVTLSTETP